MTRVDGCMKTIVMQVMRIYCHEPGKSKWIWCDLAKNNEPGEKKKGRSIWWLKLLINQSSKSGQVCPHRTNVLTISSIITSHSSTSYIVTYTWVFVYFCVCPGLRIPFKDSSFRELEISCIFFN